MQKELPSFLRIQKNRSLKFKTVSASNNQHENMIYYHSQIRRDQKNTNSLSSRKNHIEIEDQIGQYLVKRNFKNFKKLRNFQTNTISNSVETRTGSPFDRFFPDQTKKIELQIPPDRNQNFISQNSNFFKPPRSFFNISREIYYHQDGFQNFQTEAQNFITLRSNQITHSQNNYHSLQNSNFRKVASQKTPNFPMNLFKSLNYFKPFSLGWIMVHNNNCANKKIKKDQRYNLNRLRKLFCAIFAFENQKFLAFAELSQIEFQILNLIIKSKPYSIKEEVSRALQSRKIQDIEKVFYQIKRDKRKEENHKFAFRILLKSLQEEFITNELSLLPQAMHIENEKYIETLFYLFFFSKKEMDMDFNQAAKTYLSEMRFKCNIHKKIKKYVFPDSKNRLNLSKFKSFSKKFFLSISDSALFISKLNENLILGYLALSLFGKYVRESDFTKLKSLTQNSIIRRILYFLAEHSNKEIVKIFSVWENIIDKEIILNSTKTFTHQKSTKILEGVILSKIESHLTLKNSRFIWSLAEMRASFLQGILSLNEYINDKDSEKQNYKSSNF